MVTLEAYLREHRNAILHIFVYIVPDDEGQEAYKVSVTAVVDPESDIEHQLELKLKEALEAMDRAENPITAVQLDTDTYGDYFIEHNVPMSIVENSLAFTLYDAANMKELNLQYLCYPLTEDPRQTIENRTKK